MRRFLVFVMVAAVIGAFAFSDAFARRGRGSGSQGMGFNRGFSPYMQQGMAQPGAMYGQWGSWGNTGYGRMYNVTTYNVTTVETINGVVTSVDQFPSMRGMWPGIHIMVKTPAENISVHLGPSWYISNQNVQIAVDDTVKVTGSRIIFNGKPAIIAAEVTKGDNILSFRDNNGFPMWSRWGWISQK